MPIIQYFLRCMVCCILVCTLYSTDNVMHSYSNYSIGSLSATALSYDDLESAQSRRMLQFIRTPKLPVNRSDSRR